MAVEWENCPIGARVEQSLEDVKETLKRIESLLEKQNGRVRALEQWRAYIIGIGAAITFIIVSVMKWIVK